MRVLAAIEQLSYRPNVLARSMVVGHTCTLGCISPNLTDYDAIRQTFTWDAATAELAGLPGGSGINIAYEAADRHVDAGDGGRVALRIAPHANTPTATSRTSPHGSRMR